MLNALPSGYRFSSIFILFFFSFVCIQCKVKSGASSVKSGSIRTLIVGGGSSHDYNRWYKQADSATLAKDGLAAVTYTSDISSILEQLPSTDVLYLSNNQPMADPKLRQAIFDFVQQGKGLVLAHAATWYNWRDWPEYNKTLVGGGSRGHERYGNFDVKITNTTHPVTKGITETDFNIKDELYRMNRDTTGAKIEVLAVATVPNTTTSYPAVWITESQKGRIVCITFGHDAESHDRPVYQQLLRNAVQWAAGRR